MVKLLSSSLLYQFHVFRLMIKNQWWKFRIEIKSLFYNNFLDYNYVADVLMEPIFWFVDNFAKFLGPFFVIVVFSLTASVVIICYIIGLPFWWNKSPETTIFLLIFGNWLLINILFHYYMGCTVSPGLPPLGALIPEAVSMCKKCITPKPPRTHHCSVCNKCILKMDHHCRILFLSLIFNLLLLVINYSIFKRIIKFYMLINSQNP